MTNARELYRLNHSALRGLSRHESTAEQRRQKLSHLCKDRRHWHGDQYSTPASLGARMALKTLGDMSCDWLDFRARAIATGMVDAGMAKHISHVCTWSYSTACYRPDRLPG